MTLTTRGLRTLLGLMIGAALMLLAPGCFLEPKNDDAADTVETTSESAATAAADDYYARPVTAFVANPFCKACHADFDEEAMVLTHAAAGIGCERCHGESLNHRSDEANITPPEMMYTPQRIVPMCMMCHPRHKLQHVPAHNAVLETNLSLFGAQAPDPNEIRVCTDCHAAEHRMKVRTVRWDKATGAVIK